MILDRGLVNAELLRLRNEYREYKERHWDKERNHIRPEFADGLYKLFRQGMIMRKTWDDMNRVDIPSSQPRIIETQLNFL